MRKFLGLFTLLTLAVAGSILAMPPQELNVTDYEVFDFDYLRTHYLDINDGRAMQVEGTFDSYKWLPPFQYKEILAATGFDVKEFHLLQFTIKEKDDYHFSYPILMIHVANGDLTELDGLVKGDKVRIFGHFYNLRKSEYALNLDALKRIRKGGHDDVLLLDARVTPTPTPTPTVTQTPGPNLWQKLKEKINPLETATPTGTITPPPR